jgi:hypothetical protein
MGSNVFLRSTQDFGSLLVCKSVDQNKLDDTRPLRRQFLQRLFDKFKLCFILLVVGGIQQQGLFGCEKLSLLGADLLAEEIEEFVFEKDSQPGLNPSTVWVVAISAIDAPHKRRVHDQLLVFKGNKWIVTTREHAIKLALQIPAIFEDYKYSLPACFLCPRHHHNRLLVDD